MASPVIKSRLADLGFLHAIRGKHTEMMRPSGQPASQPASLAAGHDCLARLLEMDRGTSLIKLTVFAQVDETLQVLA